MSRQRALKSSSVSVGFFCFAASPYFSWIFMTDSASMRACAGSYTPHGRSQCAWTTRRGRTRSERILESMTPPSEVASSETYHRRRKAMTAAVAALVVAIVRLRPFRVEVRGHSMRPALEAGDWCIATAGGRIRTGDVVVVEQPDRPGFELVKRVTGAPGDE